jgi:hypothetical protein
MVRIVARCVAVLALVLPLASCIFFASAFPPTLAQIVARTDLSTVIPAGSGSNYQVYCVTVTAAPPGEFVLLMNRNVASDPVVVVLDSSLNLIQTYNFLLLNGPGWGNGSFSGNSLMADANGNVEIGTLGFSADELRNVLWSPSWTANPPVSGPSFSSPSAGRNDINFHINSGNMLGYDDRFAGWGLHFGASCVITAVPGVQFEVAGVFNIDDASAGGSVILVLRENNGSTAHVVAIPRSDITTNGGVVSPILDNYPNESFNNVDSSSIVFAGDCLVAYSYDSHALIRYALTPPFKEISRLPVGQNVHPLTYASTADGSYSVQFDQTTRVLTKVAKWW